MDETVVIHILIMNEMLDLYEESRELKRLRHLYDEAMSSVNIASRGQEEDGINQRELDRGAM